MDILYGRDTYISSIVEEVIGGKSPVSLIHGKTGMGKTAIAKKIVEIFKEQDLSVTYFSVEGSIQAYEEPFLKHLRNLLADAPDRELSFAQVAATVVKNPESKLAKIISGMFQDLTAKCGADNTVKAVTDIFTSSVDSLIDNARLLAQSNRDSFYTEYNDALKTIISATGSKSVIIIDHIENASEQLSKFIEAFSINKPDQVGLVLVVNDEKYKGLECIRKLRPELQCLGVKPHELSGLTKEDLSLWLFDFKSVKVSDEVIDGILLELDGRPEFLKTWIDNGDFSLKATSKYMKNYGFYDEIYNKLSNEAKSTARVLALFPISYQMSIDLLSKIIKADLVKAIDIVEELESVNYIIRYDCRVRLRHQHIKKFLLENKVYFTNANIGEFLHIIEEAVGCIDITSANLPLLEAKAELALGSGSPENLPFLASVVRRQLQHGAYSSSVEIAKRVENIIENTQMHQDILRDLRLLKAECFEQIGEYYEGIKQLNLVDLSTLDPRSAFDAIYLTAKLYLRLNEYAKSLERIENGYNLAIDLDDTALLSKILILKGHILRDTEQYDEALKVADQLLTYLVPKISDELLKGHMLRSISRAHSSLFMGDSVSFAEDSIKIAKENISKKDEGNGYFTLGEAYRMTGNYEACFEPYQSGLAIAVQHGNKDLQIYCNLGLVAAEISSGDFCAAEKTLQLFGSLEARKFPVEATHLTALRYILGACLGNHDDQIVVNELITTYSGRFLKPLAGQYLERLSGIEDRVEACNFVKINPYRF